MKQWGKERDAAPWLGLIAVGEKHEPHCGRAKGEKDLPHRTGALAPCRGAVRPCLWFSHFCSSFPFAAFGAILQSSLFGLAGLLPASYTAPIMSGQGLAGTFAALAMIFSIASE